MFSPDMVFANTRIDSSRGCFLWLHTQQNNSAPCAQFSLIEELVPRPVKSISLRFVLITIVRAPLYVAAWLIRRNGIGRFGILKNTRGLPFGNGQNEELLI